MSTERPVTPPHETGYRTPSEELRQSRLVQAAARLRIGGGISQPSRYLFVLPILIYLVLLGYPIVYNIAVSFENMTIQNFASGSAPFSGLDNYRAVFADDTFSQTVHNAILFTIGSVVPQFVIGFALALLVRRPTRLSRLARPLILFPWLLPQIAVATVFIWFFDSSNGIVNWVVMTLHIVHSPISWLADPSWALAIVIMANIWIGVPFYFSLLHTGLQSLPQDLHEAAAVDGAGVGSELLHLTMPLMRDTILAVLILGIIGTIKVFDLVFIMTGGGPANATQLLATLAYQYSFTNFQFGPGAALVNLMVAVLLVFAAVYVLLARRTNTE